MLKITFSSLFMPIFLYITVYVIPEINFKQ
jgi:hypothetical protein